MEVSLYIHIPFCRHRCAYCDFNTYAGLEQLIPAYLDALTEEIRQVAEVAGRVGAEWTVATVFLGGGTPSVLPVEGLAALLAACRQAFHLAEGAEITLEANPGTLSRASLEGLRREGFNRISLGMQSAHPADLRLLERQHDTFDVIRAVQWAREAGFEQLNLDLIFGIPGQTLERWQETLKLAAGMQPEHLSLYALTIEHGTPFGKWIEGGLVELPDEDLAADQYEFACTMLADEGYHHYEISNWARENEDNAAVCRHNLQYWRNLPYIGLGAGAHGYWNGARTVNVRGVSQYIARVREGKAATFPGGPAAEQVNPVSEWIEMQETMMVGLRLVEEGVGEQAFMQRFGLPLAMVFRKPIERLIQRGLIEWAGDAPQRRLRLTRQGWLLGNQVFGEFIGLPEVDYAKAGRGYSTTTRVP